ncbi:MAG: hypothetical protein AB7N71_12215 [Phycisphaerae bacterium]
MRVRDIFVFIAAAQAVSAIADVKELLRFTPKGAGLVVVVPHVNKLADSVGAFGRLIEVDSLANWNAKSFLDRFEMLGANAGIDVNGALVVVDNPLRGSCILCELDNPQAWKDAAGAKELQNGIFRFGDFVESRAYFPSERVLLIAESEEDLASLLAETGTGHGDLVRVFENADVPSISVFINVEPWRMYAGPALMFARNSMMVGVQNAGQGGMESAIEFWNLVFDTLSSLIDEAKSLRVDFRVTGEGVTAALNAQFSAKGKAADYLAAAKPSSKDILRGLPDRAAPVMFAAEWTRGANTPCLSSMLVKAMAAKAAPKDAEAAARFNRAIEMNQKMYTLVSGYNGLVGLENDKEGIISCGVNLSDAADDVTQQVVESYQLSPELLNAFTTGISAETSHSREELSGKMIDVFKLGFDSEDEQVRKALQSIYGKGTTVMITSVSDGAAYSIGPEAQAREALSQIIAAAENPEKQLAQNTRVKTLRSRLPKHPAALVMLDLPQAAGYLYDFARRFGAGLPELQIPAPADEVAGAGIYFEPTSIRAHVFVPADGARAMVKFVTRVREARDR